MPGLDAQFLSDSFWMKNLMRPLLGMIAKFEDGVAIGPLQMKFAVARRNRFQRR